MVMTSTRKLVLKLVHNKDCINTIKFWKRTVGLKKSEIYSTVI